MLPARASLSLAVLCLAGGEVWAGIPSALSQRNPSARSPVCSGCTTAEGPEIELTASSDARLPDGGCGGQGRLEFEVQPLGSAFTNVSNLPAVGGLDRACVVQQYDWLPVYGLSVGTRYLWQVREVVGEDTPGPWVPFSGGSVAFGVGTPPPTALVFTTPPQVVTAGSCSSMTTLQNQDGGVAVAPSSPTPISLVVTPPSIHLFGDPNCASPLDGGLSLDVGVASVSFYWMTSEAVGASFAADAVGVLWARQQSTVVGGPPVTVGLAIPTEDVSLVAGACVRGSRLSLLDTFGNPATVANSVLVSLSGVPCGSFYADPACTQPISAVSASTAVTNVFWMGGVPGPVTLTASSSGLRTGSASTTLGGAAIPQCAAGPADAGPGQPPERFAVGSSCSAGPPALSALAWWLLTAAVWRRRRSSRPG